ncbi:hypothetical protein ECG_01482 [Echinococcus granulosus]|nr:hypothetical protein ECG_01482 [Echinococcus granulosus]
MVECTCVDNQVFSIQFHDLEVGPISAMLRLKALTMKLNCSYFFWIGDSTNQFSVRASSLYCENSLFPSVRSTPETTLARRLSKRLGCPVYLSLSIHAATLDKWELVDPVSQKTISQEVEGQLLDRFRGILCVQQLPQTETFLTHM